MKHTSLFQIIGDRNHTSNALVIMVYYFTSNVVDPPAQIYVGKDKFESVS